MTFRRLPCPVTPKNNFVVSGFYEGILLFFLSVAAVFVGGASAWALTISPPLYEIGATPGQTLTTSLKVFNETESDSTWYFSTENFTSQGEQGEPKFYAGGTSNTFDLASWIIPPRAPITIKSGETRQVEFVIEVPKNAEPGGHYFLQFFARVRCLGDTAQFNGLGFFQGDFQTESYVVCDIGSAYRKNLD